jgi:hypothetical protein
VLNYLTRGCAIAAASLLCLTGGSVPAQAATAPGWRLTEVFGTGASNNDPLWPAGLAATSPDSAWMAYYGCNWPCSDATATVEHWNGHRWAPVPAAELHGIQPNLITASSASDAWLVGSLPGKRYPGALHWNGKAWKNADAPGWVIRINGSGDYDLYPADFGPDNLWLFSLGGYYDETTAFAVHYEHGDWTKSYLPDIPESAAAVSSTDIWVVGQSFSGKGPEVMLHWNGRKWSTSAVPKQREAGSPTNLISTGPRDLWLDWIPSKSSEAPYLLHWTGAGWTKVTFPDGASGFTAAGDGTGGLWLSGFSAGKNPVQLFMHWSAGKWTISKVPNGSYSPGNVDELALIPGTSSVWAIGNVYTNGTNALNRSTIWRYNP